MPFIGDLQTQTADSLAYFFNDTYGQSFTETITNGFQISSTGTGNENLMDNDNNTQLATPYTGSRISFIGGDTSVGGFTVKNVIRKINEDVL